MNTTTKKDLNSCSSGTNESLRTSFTNSCTKVEQCVQRDPKTAMLVSLGAGLGIGLLAGMALGGSRKSASHSWLDRRTAEDIGHKLMSNVSRWVPDAVSDRFST